VAGEIREELEMSTFSYKDKKYELDKNGFLNDFSIWDKNFAEGMAFDLEIPQGLTKEHWDVINFIRGTFEDTGRCPLVYETCRKNGLNRKELKKLFPTGYLRGACKLAGITYREGFLGQAYIPVTAEDVNVVTVQKNYSMDVRGFLVNPDDWDEFWAAHRAYDMKIHGGKLTEKHWQVIKFLRDHYKNSGEIPNIYDTCEALNLELPELEELFPDGYHRGAIKISGLRMR